MSNHVFACCTPAVAWESAVAVSATCAIERIVRDPASVGINTASLAEAGERDEAIVEFSRFYEERRGHEVEAAGSDARKRQKLEDEFTPRLDMVVAGLQGMVHREVTLRVRYSYGGGGDYESDITVRPGTSEILHAPETELCAKTGHYAPKECLGRCEVSSAKVLRHLLITSEFSGRSAQLGFTECCELSGKRALADELEGSAVTGKRVASVLLKESALSGARAEPDHFGVCAFTNDEVLKSELRTSDVSGKPYRADQMAGLSCPVRLVMHRSSRPATKPVTRSLGRRQSRAR
jgi:hypothetical protein